jgi:hypothetical protein
MDTFKVMWDLSAPGGGAEGCFLRLDQTEYYREARTEPNPLEMMPDVSNITPSIIPNFELSDLLGTVSPNMFPKVP